MTPSLEIEPGPHSWEVRALTTTPALEKKEEKENHLIDHCPLGFSGPRNNTTEQNNFF